MHCEFYVHSSVAPKARTVVQSSRDSLIIPRAQVNISNIRGSNNPTIRFPKKVRLRHGNLITALSSTHDCPSNNAVCLQYEDLLNLDKDLSEEINKAFGPSGLGILTVKDVPKYSKLRQNLLPLAQKLAYLTDEKKSELEDPESLYSFGWSHGKEILESGVPDSCKGSFYANPVYDMPSTDPQLQAKYPTYCRPNIWPGAAVPELEAAFKELGSLMVQVGTVVARRCDKLVKAKAEEVRGDLTCGDATGGRERMKGPRTVGKEVQSMSHVPGNKQEGKMERLIATSQCHKGRLLHYFPTCDAPGEAPDDFDNSPMNTVSASLDDPLAVSFSPSDAPAPSSWCGWHKDHGLLTGLTCAMYSQRQANGSFVAVSNPDPESSGLYVQTRLGETVKVEIPEDCLAFQLGEVAQVLSGGRLQATPHCVRAAMGDKALGVGRSTFAVFMQPRWDEPMAPLHPIKEGIDIGVQGWDQNMNFGEFTENRIHGYYRR